jgi:hypothetical protein
MSRQGTAECLALTSSGTPFTASPNDLQAAYHGILLLDIRGERVEIQVFRVEKCS